MSVCVKREKKKGMKDEEGRHGNHSRRQGARVTEGRLREVSVILCGNKAMLFHVPLKAVCQWAGADRTHQPDLMIMRLTY